MPRADLVRADVRVRARQGAIEEDAYRHVNGRGATAGCVSVPRAFMRTLVGRLDPAAAPVMAVGR